MQTIDYLHIIEFVLLFVAAIYKLHSGQYEHFYTRLMASCWFGFTVVFQDIDVSAVRIISNCVIIAIPSTEILSPLFMKYWKHK